MSAPVLRAALLLGMALALAGCGATGTPPTAADRSSSDDGQLPACDPAAPPLHKGLIVGTWVPEGQAGFDETWLDEVGLREAYTLRQVSRRSWRGFTSGDERIKVDTLLRDRQGPAVGYLYSLVSRATSGDVPPDRDAVLHVGHRGRVRAFLDGRLVLDQPPAAPGTWAEARTVVHLTGPYDVLLLKLGRGSPELGDSMDVEVRLSAPDGSPLPGQTWNTMRPPGLPSDL